MNKEEFEKLKAGDYVKVKAWEDIKMIVPVEMGRFCDKLYRVVTIDTVAASAILKDLDGTPIGRLFVREVLESVSMGTLYYDDINVSCGKIGKATKMTDYDGMPLFVGDVVNVKYIIPKDKRETLKKFESDILGYAGKQKKDDEELHKIKQGFKLMMSQTVEKVYTTVVVEYEGKAFICGIEKSYNDNEQDTERFKVKKIIDHLSVQKSAVIEGIKFRRE